MTFGALLKQIIELTQIKACHLASELGYDPSYVSRWLNDLKLPALSGNEQLLESIAASIAKLAGTDGRNALAQYFDFPSADREICSRCLEDHLQLAYRQSKTQQTKKNAGYTGGNATLSVSPVSTPFPESVVDAVREAANIQGRVEMLCTTPIHAQFENNEHFFQRITHAVGSDCSIRVIQFVDMEDVTARVDSACRSFCYLMGMPYGVEYEFYELKPGSNLGGYTYLIRNSFMIQYITEPISKKLFLLESHDPEIVSQYCTAADGYTLNRTPMTKAANMKKLMENQYFLDYFMQPDCRCLLKWMQPIFFPESLQKKLLPKEQRMVRDFGLFLDGSQFFESILLYKSALVDYVHTGRLMAFGHSIVVPREDRLEHLQFMLQQLKEHPEKNLYILSTNNRVCSFDNLPTSMFVSRNAAFALQNLAQLDTVRYTVTSTPMIRQLNRWLDHMQAMPSDQCLTGADALSYIERCIRLL